jgi:hypothetical protein
MARKQRPAARGKCLESSRSSLVTRDAPLHEVL